MSVLSLSGLARRFGAVRAVDGLSLEVAAGEVVCLLGPSGCGKSTALRMIAGFETPDAGDIRIDGASVLAVPPNRRATGMVFQSHALWSHMTVAGNIAFGLRLRRLPRPVVAAKVAEALELVGLAGYQARYPRQLSGGQQQRVALARSLVLAPRILLLDEPFSSLDAHLRVRLRDELKAIQRRLGLTTLFVTHDQDEAMALGDRLVVMNRGAVEQVGPPAEIYDRPATLFAAGFIGAMNLRPAELAGGMAAAGSLAVPAPGARPGEQLAIAVRPEDCDLAAPGARGAIAGTVEQVTTLGAIRLVAIVLGDGSRLQVQAGRRTMPAVGERVGVVVGRALVYRDGRAPIETGVSDTRVFAAPAAVSP